MTKGWTTARRLGLAPLLLLVGFGLAGCSGNDEPVGDDDDDNTEVCVYEDASEICQQAYDCCNQYLQWAVETEQPLADVLDCEGYTCSPMLDETCQEFIDEAVATEETFEQDWPDCN